MDAGKRRKTPGTETKDFITHGTVGSINVIFVLATLLPHVHRGNVESPGGYCTFSVFVSQLKKSE